MRQIKRLKYVLLVVLMNGALLGSGFFTSGASAANISVGGPSDCDNNAVIRCGAHSTSALMAAYQSSPYVQNVYSSFGISSADMNNLATTNTTGRVTRGGQVFVDGQSSPVATGAMTGGRVNMPGSTKVTSGNSTFYRRSTRASFQQNSLPAFVSMSNGRFRFAIIASCGNAVTATPVVAPKPKPAQAAPSPAPAPTPAPAQSQTQTQSQQVTIQTPAQTPAAPAAAPAPAAPKALPSTGASGVAGLFTAGTLAGYLGYRRYLARRNFH